MNRVYNFSAGPSALPVSVLEKAQAELLSYGESGMAAALAVGCTVGIIAVGIAFRADMALFVSQTGLSLPLPSSRALLCCRTHAKR